MSCSDLLNKFDDLVRRFRQEFNEIVERERANLKAEVDALNAERQRMEAIKVSDDDIIHLNVGGKVFTTTRDTLCQVEGSLLATMFNGRWEDRMKRDKDGVVFFDFNPEYFGWILDYLREKKISTPENPVVLAEVPKNHIEKFNTLLDYLGLSYEILSARPSDVARQKERFNMCSSGIFVQEDGRVAVHSPRKGHEYALGKNIYQRGIVRFKLKLECFKDNHWIMVGILEADVALENDDSYVWSGSNGWSLGDNGQVYKDGSLTHNDSLKKQSRQGDTVEIVLDCDAGKLSLHLPTTDQQFEIDIRKSQAWRLHVNLFCANDKIRIVEVVQG